MRIDLDPTPQRAVLIGVLLFLESFIGGLLTLLQNTEDPTMVQICIVLLVACLQLVTFLSAFLRTGDLPEDTKKKET